MSSVDGYLKQEDAMLDRSFQIDPYYLQARHAERLRAAEAARLARSAHSYSEVGLKARLYNAAGDLLIDWGQKLKKNTANNDLCQDCA